MTYRINDKEVASLFQTAEKEGYTKLVYVAMAEEFCITKGKPIFIYTAVFINKTGDSKRFF